MQERMEAPVRQCDREVDRSDDVEKSGLGWLLDWI